MKIIPLVLTIFSTYFSIGQKSYYFSQPLPSVGKSVNTIDEGYFGTYHSQSIARSYEFSETGIKIISTSISSIDRESIRELSKYDVRNGYIFGVVENDSLPCVLQDDRYYFGINITEEIIGTNTENVLTKINASNYILNYDVDGVFTPVQIKFEGKNVTIEQFDYDLETTMFDFINDQHSIDGKYHEMVILNPNVEEFNELLAKGVFAVQGIFKRNRK